jgi:hypothetical protein
MEDTITFSVLTDRTTVTIATYAPTGNINPYISLRKITSDNSSEYLIDLIIVFIFQTILLPIVFLYFLYVMFRKIVL